jgi:Phage terminase large subunit
MPNIPLTDVYEPLVKQAAFHQSTAPYRLHVGGYGSGKTLNLLWEGIITCRMVPGCNCLILRTTSPDIQKTVINKFLNPKMVPRWIYESYNKNEKIVYFNNGSQLHFGYCQHEDDVNQFLSTEYVFIGLEEAGEFSYRVWERLVGRARAPIDMVDINGNKVQPSMGLTTNPYGNGWGWIKTLWGCRMDGTQSNPQGHKGQGSPMPGMGKFNSADYWYVHSTVVDNPYVFTSEYVEKLEGMTGTLRAQALYGDMDQREGQYYPQFNTGQHEGIHVMDPKDIRFKSWEPVWIGADWGLAHAFPVYWMTKGWIKSPDGERCVNVVYRERIYHEMNPIQVASEIVRACKHEEDERGKILRVTEPIKHFYFSWERFMRHESNHTIAEQLGNVLIKYGVPRPTPADKSRVDGWVLISQLLDMDELVITTDCPMAISALPTLIRNSPDNPEDVKKIDSIEDDIADAIRYGIKSYLRPGQVPQSVRDANALDQIKDPVARQIRAYEMYLKKQEPKRPVKDTRKLAWELGK